MDRKLNISPDNHRKLFYVVGKVQKKYGYSLTINKLLAKMLDLNVSVMARFWF
jgi:hypothetical protein